MVLRRTGVAITMCVLGSIDTEGNRSNTRGEINPALPRHPVEPCARAVVRACALRKRELYHPAQEVLPVLLLLPWMPELLDWAVRKIMVPAQKLASRAQSQGGRA